MKKSLLTLILCIVALSVGYAQFTDGTVLQPTHVVGRRINSAGEITKELTADFTYAENGKVSHFDFPDFCISSGYAYSGDYLMRESTFHSAGYPIFYDVFNYTYENGQIKTKSHLWDQMNDNEYWEYSYDEEGRLIRIDYGESYVEEYHMHYLYEYENDGRTKIENYWTSWASQGLLLRKRTVYQYDEAFNLLSVHSESYDTEGELTNTTLVTYTYTGSGQQETEITQTLNENEEWENTSIMEYVYNEADQLIERLDGVWDEDREDWNITRRIVFEIDEEASNYIVSFYKKNGEEWIRDMFNNQTILFGPNLKTQQRALGYMVYEEMNEPGRINQFVFTLAEMNEPTYVNTEEKQELTCGVYPNPGSGNVKIESHSENAVVRFYDLQGRLVTARLFSFGTTIDTESWPSGIYLWEIWQDNQKAASGKWVKE